MKSSVAQNKIQVFIENFLPRLRRQLIVLHIIRCTETVDISSVEFVAHGPLYKNFMPPFIANDNTQHQVVIFNWNGRPNKTTMLDKLAVMCDAAMKVARESRQGAFGHLVILLRNVWSGEVCLKTRNKVIRIQVETPAATAQQNNFCLVHRLNRG